MNVISFHVSFLYRETTGLPAFEGNKTRITELCLISAQSDHIYSGVIPRVQNKLNLCFNPLKRIQPEAEKITGLYNDDLSNESSFNETSLNLLHTFIKRLSKPICFVAHNGARFDYPILRNHIEQVGDNFPDDVLCIDSLTAFQNLLRTKKTETTPISNAANESLLTDEWDESLIEAVDKLETTYKSTLTTEEQQKQNETTPTTKSHSNSNISNAPKKSQNRKQNFSNPQVVRKLNFGQTTFTRYFCEPKQSFKLVDVYTRLVQRPVPDNAHHAEADVQMLLACAVHLGEVFFDWANLNAISFNQIPKMELNCSKLR